MQFRTLLLFIFCLSFSVVGAKGYDIKIQISGVSDTTVILGNYFNKSMFPKDTMVVDSKGIGSFKAKKDLPQGMYLIYLPSGKYFQIMMGADQDFSIKTDTSNFIENAVVEGSADNEIFFDFQKYMFEKQQEINQIQEKIKNSANEKEKEKAIETAKKLTGDRKEKIKKIVAENPDLFVSTFLLATLDIEVPDPPKMEDGSIDSSFQYLYYRTHFFDNFDPSDGRLLLTPLYEDKIMYYLEKVIPQIPDTLISEIDILIDGARSDSALFRYLLITLFNHYGKSNIMGMDAVQLHIAEKYYITEAWWSDDKFINDIKERVDKMKPLLIGKVTPDIELLIVPSPHFPKAANDTALKRYPHIGELHKISEIKADFLVLIFWEASCSHCKKSVPDLYKIYQDTLKDMGVQVLSVSTLFGEEGKEDWVDFVNKHELYDWINAWNPYDYNYKMKYDIRSTPQIFILNKYKEIIGKRLGSEQVVDFIEMYIKQNGRDFSYNDPDATVQ